MKQRLKMMIMLLGLSIGFVMFGAAQTTQAATYTVTNTADSGAGSLRQAIAAANASVDADAINFALAAGDAGCTAGVCTITLTSGELSVSSAATAGALTIANSTGASNLLISGNNASRVFYLNAGNLTLHGVTITKGLSPILPEGYQDHGGGIYNYQGTLTLLNSIVSSNNSGVNSGGGIISIRGTTTLTDSIVSDNSAGGYGGGIYINGGTTTLTNSTVSGNRVPTGTSYASGGGVYVYVGTLTSVNSTFSGNQASFGGGVYNVGTTTSSNSTFSNNSATYGGGGIWNNGGLTINNSILADSTSGGDCGGYGTFNVSYSLIEDGGCGITNGVNNNLTGDPLLGALQNNGGATPTHALLEGSIAIDAGNSTLPTDQRGLPRPVDLPNYPNAANGSDIGAFELQNVSPEQLIANLTAAVKSTNLPKGIENALVVKLNDATAALAAGNKAAAIDALQSFINQARAQAGKKLTTAQASSLISAAQKILDALQ